MIPHLQAYKKGIFFPKFLLLTLAWYEESWWKVDTENLSCTVDQREKVLESSLAFIHIEYLNEAEHANRNTTTGIVSYESKMLSKVFI